MKKIISVVFLAVLFGVIVLGCATPGSKMTSHGEAIQIPVLSKDFTILGHITVKSTAVFNGDGEITSGSKITFEMLLNEAYKLGADDIANLRIDEYAKKTMTEVIQAGSPVMIPGFETSYTATALAIKYISPVK